MARVVALAGVLFAASGTAAIHLERKGPTLYYCDAPVRLIGYGDPGILAESTFDFAAYLDALAQAGLNLTRVALVYPAANDLMPWAGGFGAWDLAQFDEAFWARLKSFVSYAESKGIVVQLTLFDGGGLDATSALRWPRSPYNAVNNTQGYCTSADEFDELDGTPPIWEEVQKPLLVKVVDTLNGHGNVLYEVMNEPSDPSGSAGFIAAVVDQLYTLLNAPGHVGSQLIAVNAFVGANAIVSNPKVDVVSFHLTGAVDAGAFSGLGKPTIVSNEGDSGSQSTQDGSSPAERLANVTRVAVEVFASEIGHMHIEVADRDVNCDTWRSENQDPSTSCLSGSVMSALGAFAATPAHLCGTPPITGIDDESDPNCPLGLKVHVDNGADGASSGAGGSYTETTGNWAPWASIGQAVGADYRYLSQSAGDGTRRGSATWTPKLTRKGLYRVTVSFRATATRTHDADYFVTDANGKQSPIEVDQTHGLAGQTGFGPIYADLGTHYFEPGKGSLTLDGNDGQSDEADSAIWTLESCLDGCSGACAAPPPLCPAPPPGPQTQVGYATLVTSSGGWGLVASAEGDADGQFAHTPDLDDGENLVGTAFGVCDPDGLDAITSVKVAVRSKVQHDSGQYAVKLEMTAEGVAQTFAHTSLGWDEIDVTAAHASWTWDLVKQVRAEVSLDSHPEGKRDSDVWVDAFRVTVGFTVCTPMVAKVCQGNDALWKDGCGSVAGLAEACDDGDSCTTDGCSAGECSHAEISSPACLEPSCTPRASQKCFGAALFWLDSCGLATEIALSCIDGDSCTADACDPTTLVCTHTKLPTPACGGCSPMAALGCQAGTNVWFDSCGNVGAIAGSCDDNNDCTEDSCDDQAGVCVHNQSQSPDCQACPPEVGLACVGNEIRSVDGCGEIGDVVAVCDDGDPCTIDACDALGMVCTHESAGGGGCPDCSFGLEIACVGNALVEKDGCGQVNHVLANCSDGDACTVDSCNVAGNACDHVLSESAACLACPPQKERACFDGNLVWVDGCGNPGSLEQLCDDGDPCTVDTCNPAQKKCTHFDSGAPFCSPCVPTGATKCFGGSAVQVDSCNRVEELLAVCSDGDDCTVDACDPVAHTCTFTPSVAPACVHCEPTVTVRCEAGVIVSLDSCGKVEGVVDDCGDGDDCTVDVCAPDGIGCVHIPSPDLTCSPCLSNTFRGCVGGQVVWFDSCGEPGTTAEECDDADACTTDACDETAAQCAHVPVEGPGCEGCAHAVTTGCYLGQRVTVDSCGNLGAIIDDCADGDPCSGDRCDPEFKGCSPRPTGAAECLECIPAVATRCSGLDIIWVDSCGNAGSVVFSCDDGVACTADWCDGSTARCMHASGPACEIEEPCTESPDVVCVNDHLERVDSCGRPVEVADPCNDSDPCTQNRCDSRTDTCAFTPLDGADCGSAPAEFGACDQSAHLECWGGGLRWSNACGQPSGIAILCDDGDPCTDDSCDPTGPTCVHVSLLTGDCAPASDATDATDAGDAGDAGDAAYAADGVEVGDGSDIAEATETADAADTGDAVDGGTHADGVDSSATGDGDVHVAVDSLDGADSTDATPSDAAGGGHTADGDGCAARGSSPAPSGWTVATLLFLLGSALTGRTRGSTRGQRQEAPGRTRPASGSGRRRTRSGSD